MVWITQTAGRIDVSMCCLVAGVDVGEGRAGDGPVCRVDDPSTGVLTPAVVGVKLVTNPAGAGVAAQGVDALHHSISLSLQYAADRS